MQGGFTLKEPTTTNLFKSDSSEWVLNSVSSKNMVLNEYMFDEWESQWKNLWLERKKY